ncbi:MAG: hypothetical protein IT581_06520 [Verrucomicrobiales bacterium]|nr:hypothetical protein [Verrucomicrobiales bacterium]
MSDHPKAQDTRARMQDIGHAVNERIPEGFAFFVLIAPPSGSGRANYCSNMKREDAVKVMKEFLIKAGAAEDWMQHIT